VVVFVATSLAAVSACRKAIDQVEDSECSVIELVTWLDVS